MKYTKVYKEDICCESIPILRICEKRSQNLKGIVSHIEIFFWLPKETIKQTAKQIAIRKVSFEQ
jgi:hypothetical protein